MMMQVNILFYTFLQLGLYMSRIYTSSKYNVSYIQVGHTRKLTQAVSMFWQRFLFIYK